jgi:hypothetical protein
VINAQSTAYAAQGLLAAGVSPSSVRKGGRSALDYLASLQAPDGHYRYSSSSDQTPVWVTGQALLAVNGAAFPLAAVARTTAAKPAAPAPAAGGGSAKAGQNSPASKPNEKPKPAANGTAPAAPEESETVPLAPASAGTDDGGGAGVPAWLIVIVAVAAAGGAVWGGWVLYRRRLPA